MKSMLTRRRIFLVAAVLAASSAATTNAQALINAANAIANATTNECEVNGQKWSAGFRYLVGDEKVFPSIFAQCHNGVATCYNQTFVRDRMHDVIDCDEARVLQHQRRLGLYLPQEVNRWPQGVVCYQYGSAFTAQEQLVFTQAMEEYHQRTAIQFIAFEDCPALYGTDTTVCNSCQHSFKFVQTEDSCHATLGYTPGADSELNFGAGCFEVGAHSTALHELGHILGLAHEHTHPDRDVVVLDHLPVGPDNYVMNSEFSKTQYNRNSIMHYDRQAGLCVPLDPSLPYCEPFHQEGCVQATDTMCDASQDETFGEAEHLTDEDLATIALMYGYGDGTTSTEQKSLTTQTAQQVVDAETTPYESVETDVDVLPTTAFEADTDVLPTFAPAPAQEDVDQVDVAPLEADTTESEPSEPESPPPPAPTEEQTTTQEEVLAVFRGMIYDLTELDDGTVVMHPTGEQALPLPEAASG